MIGLGCDHGGLELKKTVMEYLDSKGIEIPIPVPQMIMPLSH